MPNHSSPFHRGDETAQPASPPPSAADLSRKAEVVEQLKGMREPTLGNDLVSLGMVRNLQVVGDYVYLRLYVGCHQLHLQEQVQHTLTQLPWCKKAYAQLCTIPAVRTTLAVSSGKGGVGKSTTAVNLAASLTRTGARVGLLDADIYGPNVPQMLGLGQAQVRVVDTPAGQRFVPLEAHGIKLMSVGLLAEPDHPLAWRGPVMHKILTQFIHEVDWGELDYLLIDLPPGTGDAQITIVQESPICGVVMVTTPQQVAVSDVRRSVHMFRQVGVPVLGLVENMSYLLCGHCGEPTPIFGAGGGAQIATELSVPLWGQVPIDPRICQQGDAGEPLPLKVPDAPLSQVFGQIAAGLNATFGLSPVQPETALQPKPLLYSRPGTAHQA
jgi:ATP-binding protein involved in chromosome partitioning